MLTAKVRMEQHLNAENKSNQTKQNKSNQTKPNQYDILITRLEAIERKNIEIENTTTSRQQIFEELLKRISEDTATEGKKTAIRDAMLITRLDAIERKCIKN